MKKLKKYNGEQMSYCISKRSIRIERKLFQSETETWDAMSMASQVIRKSQIFFQLFFSLKFHHWLKFFSFIRLRSSFKLCCIIGAFVVGKNRWRTIDGVVIMRKIDANFEQYKFNCMWLWKCAQNALCSIAKRR